MKHYSTYSLFLLFILYGSSCNAPSKQIVTEDCGIYRWFVKTLTDKEGAILFNSEPTNSTIEILINEKRNVPDHERNNDLRYEDEKRKLKIEATIIFIKLEKDNDFHIVLKSGSNTLVGEVPDGNCSSFINQPKLGKLFNDLRANIINAIGFTPTSSFKKVNKHVVVEGIPFWDEVVINHKPKGSSSNQHELHPITNIVFI